MNKTLTSFVASTNSTLISNSHSKGEAQAASAASTAVTSLQPFNAAYFGDSTLTGEPVENLVRSLEGEPDGAARLERARQRLGVRLAEAEPRSIRTLRLAAGMSQQRLAELAGLPQSHIARLEVATSNPTMSTLRRVADVLGVKASELATQWDTIAEENE